MALGRCRLLLFGLALIPAFTLPACGTGPQQGRFVFFADGQTPDQVRRVSVMDWTGAVRSFFQLPQPLTDGFPPGFTPTVNVIRTVSPDGKRLLLNDGRILDTWGHPMGRLDPSRGLGGALWADDSHLCLLTTDGYSPLVEARGPARLDVVRLDGTIERSVGGVGVLSPTEGLAILACSRTSNLAVVASFARSGQVHGGPGRFTAARAIDLRGGRTILERTSAAPFALVASADGRLIGQTSFVSQDGALVATSQVVTVPSARVRGMPLDSVIDGFSGDDSRVVLTNLPSATGAMLSVRDIGGGRTVWSTRTDRAVQAQVGVSPASDAVMLEVTGPSGDGLTLVDGNGRATVVATNVGDLYAYGLTK